ncbi:response regulator [Luteibacter sp.]|uniref:response regulator n=1 Tax=Luteibacter sp. TaxID=1886636 RepID=UPI002F3F8B78
MEGAQVAAVRSGQEALELLLTGQHDTLLSDIGMPGMDGLTLIEHVRASDKASGVMAIALTGFGRLQDERRALQAGFDAYLSKPVSMNALLGELARVMRRKKTRGMKERSAPAS